MDASDLKNQVRNAYSKFHKSESLNQVGQELMDLKLHLDINFRDR